MGIFFYIFSCIFSVQLYWASDFFVTHLVFVLVFLFLFIVEILCFLIGMSAVLLLLRIKSLLFVREDGRVRNF